MERIELKKIAKENIKKNKSIIVKLILINILTVLLLTFVENFSDKIGEPFSIIISIISGCLSILVALGCINAFINIAKGNESGMLDFYKPFQNGSLNKIFTAILSQIYIIFWTMLFIIPGIIKSFSYALVPYILVDEEDLTYNEAITKSRRMMDGHKLDLFVLKISFLPWYLLVVCTLGIASFYVYPYIETTVARFYLELKNKEKNKVYGDVTDRVDLAKEADIIINE